MCVFVEFWSSFPVISSAFVLLLTQFLPSLVCRRQELEGRARERYSRLDRLSNERNCYWDQYDALDALVEALRTDNRWLKYRLQVVWDAFLDLGAQAVEDTSAVERVTTALLERDEALRKAREDLAVMRIVAAEWEMEVASTRAQLQLNRATLEGARSWQSQAEEKAKEAEQLRAELADKATVLATVEGQLQQEQNARQQAEARLQQERSTLEEARAALERERMALEEA
jgi:DNA repair exonuclease SbcCD ATPase subunit